MTGYIVNPAEQVARIVGCRHEHGACIVHQRAIDRPRPGCPYVDSILRDARIKAVTA